MTHAPIVPAAVTPGGPFGIALGPWQVRFGPLVTLADPYDPDDPLAAARFAEAVRDAVVATCSRRATHRTPVTLATVERHRHRATA